MAHGEFLELIFIAGLDAAGGRDSSGLRPHRCLP